MVVPDRTRLTGRLNLFKFMTLQQYINSIRSESIAVLGIGVSNLPLIRLLCANQCDVTACDRRSEEQLGQTADELRKAGCKLRLGAAYLENLHENIIFRTPGLMPFDPHLTEAAEKGSIVTSEMEVFFKLAPCPIIAVTGSDGKTTTTSIIYELLKAAGYTVHVGGNIGKPLLCELPNIRAEDYVVLELSSFQLHSMFCRPDVAVITNVSPNHLDKHKDFQDYIDAKRYIFLNQTAEDRLVLMANDPMTPYYVSQCRSRLSLFSDTVEIQDGCIAENGKIFRVSNGQKEFVMNTDEIRIPGAHNVRNYLAAFEAVKGLVSPDTCREVAMRFPGVPHRLEEVRIRYGVTYINDSIASSPTRTIAGLRAVKTKPIVIAGGYDKHIPFDSLGDAFNELAKAVILTGDTSEKIESSILRSSDYHGLPVFHAADLQEAVQMASGMASEGDIVILSPACASFDRFKNFEERGNAFRKYVLELPE